MKVFKTGNNSLVSHNPASVNFVTAFAIRSLVSAQTNDCTRPDDFISRMAAKYNDKCLFEHPAWAGATNEE
jgi:hypothetical protein